MRRIERVAAVGLLQARFDWWTRRRVKSLPGLERIGSAYGGWTVPLQLLDRDSIVFLAGVGEDASFDLGLIDRTGCIVHAFDPTPKAAAYAATIRESRFRFEPVGVWDADELQRFYAPADLKHVSHSIVNLQRTNTWFEAPCKSVKSLLRERGSDRIDLLKLDIEGAEYRVLDGMLRDGILPGILCVEFDELHHPVDAAFRSRIRSAVDRLVERGYLLTHVERSGNYTLVLRPWMADRTARIAKDAGR